jgi:hypothetical protein
VHVTTSTKVWRQSIYGLLVVAFLASLLYTLNYTYDLRQCNMQQDEVTAERAQIVTDDRAQQTKINEGLYRMVSGIIVAATTPPAQREQGAVLEALETFREEYDAAMGQLSENAEALRSQPPKRCDY